MDAGVSLSSMGEARANYIQHHRAKSILIRGLGVIFLIAFGTYWWQSELLYGLDGILPVGDYMKSLHDYFGGRNFRQYPTLSWWNTSSGFLQVQCAIGMLAAIFVILGRLPWLAILICWFLYLSIISAGQIFYYFQWDILLLEAALLTAIVAIGSSKNRENTWVLWLIWFLLFKLMFLSGVVKLTSGDQSWRDGTALTYHYFTQPLPNVFSYYFHHAPLFIHKLSCWVMFFVELVVPFFILIGGLLKHLRKARHVALFLHRFAALSIIALMAIIFLSGNYNFFNLLVALLAVSLLDDGILTKSSSPRSQKDFSGLGILGKTFSIGAFVFITTISSYKIYTECVGQRVGAQNLFTKLSSAIAPFKSINSYGLFRVMTTTRPEIIFEGSNDGVNWSEYSFYWKASDLDRRPFQAAPYQPRLDWQLWFAALGNIDYNPWVYAIVRHMLEGNAQMEKYISHNPFPEKAPTYIRSRLFDYEFVNEGEDWWKRIYVRDYTRILRLEDFNS